MRTKTLSILLPAILVLACDVETDDGFGERGVDKGADGEEDDGEEDDGKDKDDDKDDDDDGGESEDTGDDPEGTGGEDDSGGDDDECTKTQGFWKNHPAAWPAGTEGEALCGTDWMDWLWTETAGGEFGEHWTLLAHQYIAASLNMAAGAEPSAAVAAAYDEATTLLEACAPVPDPDEASALATTLDAYNNGHEGTNECDEDDTGGDDTGGDDTGDDTGETGDKGTGGDDTGFPIPEEPAG